MTIRGGFENLNGSREGVDGLLHLIPRFLEVCLLILALLRGHLDVA